MKRIKLRQLVFLQAAMMIYTLSGIMAKLAAGAERVERMLFFFFLDLVFLGIYALFWQQLIKRLPLSTAYVNRSMVLLWSALWAKFIFQEDISLKQLISIGLVIVGTIMVNGDQSDSAIQEVRK